MRLLSGKAPLRTVLGGTLAAGALAALALPALGVVHLRADPLDGGFQEVGPCDVPAFGPGMPAFDGTMARLVAGALLSAQETALGITPDQMEAWRAYTGALIAFIPTGERVGRWTDRKTREEAAAFDLVDDITSSAIERADKAKTLQAAADALKAKLTPGQLDMVKQMQSRLVERVVRFVEWRRGEGLGAPL
ncbi:hypothetical protein [Ancylobacter mangrovi]|uniref:hypothetical protein n=1 Tax=Ancylobacter mangrovi TaxID=2972472 RepID=UPI00216178B9|nr:hypothetical protein [Ancylobacter mangrovi]MCS0501189.1 hypothetical protein [Ancylobacter mangrovi]